MFDSISYDEFAMIEAVKEYSTSINVSALQVAEKYKVPVSELHKEFAKYKAVKYGKQRSGDNS